ncbi:MAG: hypothetical protein CSA21_02425 [Deltaproteobacteria bacterium]|nr:MAG: hypothetical protein CSA21_02425 [Deltaproteobacteria bacterium]
MRLCLACHETRLAVLFDNASALHIYEVEGEVLSPAGHLALPGGDIATKVASLAANRVHVLLCGGISGCTLRMITSAGVEVFPWICGEIDTVLTAWQQQTLQEITMPGCKGQCRRQGCGKGPGRLGHRPNQSRGNPFSNTLNQGSDHMKLAISSQGTTLDSMVDPRFGRAKGFIIYDLDTETVEYASNDQNLNIPQGAGIQTAQNVAATGATAVITGNVGPKAFAALKQGQITMYLFSNGTVAQAIEAYKKGELTPTADANKQGHW